MVLFRPKKRMKHTGGEKFLIALRINDYWVEVVRCCDALFLFDRGLLAKCGDIARIHLYEVESDVLINSNSIVTPCEHFKIQILNKNLPIT